KNYYELLEIAAGAPIDEVKKAFRLQIARYHPDKVQHLGKEFQTLAADRAAELTEAWRILSDAGRKAEYDKSIAGDAGTTAAPTVVKPEASPEPERPAHRPPEQFTQERASRDTFIRKATIDRVRQSFVQVAGASHEETRARDFDFVAVPRSRGIFSRGKGLSVVARFVARVEAAAVADAWTQAMRSGLPCEEICVMLMGPAVVAARELADAIAEQRRKTARGGPRITLIPINSSVWDAHIPTDAPALDK